MKDKTFKQQVEDAVKQSIFEVTGCADLKAGKLYLSKVLTKSVLAAHNAELDRIADQERVCKKCLKPYNAPSLCPVCEKRLTNDIP